MQKIFWSFFSGGPSCDWTKGLTDQDHSCGPICGPRPKLDKKTVSCYIRGIFLAGNLNQVWVQTVAILASGTYSFIVTLIIVVVIDKIIGFRVNDEIEEMGLDTTQHGQTGYNMV